MESKSLNDGTGWSHSHHVFFLFFINALCGIYYPQCVTGNKSQGRPVAFPGTDTLQTSEPSPLFFLLLSATFWVGAYQILHGPQTWAHEHILAHVNSMLFSSAFFPDLIWFYILMEPVELFFVCLFVLLVILFLTNVLQRLSFMSFQTV